MIFQRMPAAAALIAASVALLAGCSGETLNYTDGAKYVLATVRTLAIPYGAPVLYSGYAFSAADDGPAQDASGLVKDARCGTVAPTESYAGATGSASTGGRPSPAWWPGGAPSATRRFGTPGPGETGTRSAAASAGSSR